MCLGPIKKVVRSCRPVFAGVVLLCGSAAIWAQPSAPSQTPLNPAARSFVSKDSLIQHQVFKSQALERDEDYAVELPASYATDKGRRYPVVFFLHGQFGNENDWERYSINELFEKMTGDHEITDMIVVMPNGRSSFFINSSDGTSKYEDFIVKELVPQIDKDYRTLARREDRGIMGVSMGGFGALTLAMKHPDVFSVVAAHSAAVLEEIPQPSSTDRRMQFRLQLASKVFGNPIDKTFWAHNNPILLADTLSHKPPLKVYFDCGDQDRFGFNVGAEVLDRTLTARHIDHEFHIFPGNHGWEYARENLPRSLKFVSTAFESSTHRLASNSGK
ncbi:MAG: alpha/beta hydrolase family protein [Acidobacteriia bacterium]|nr:alpha/beta hydrolase family protein [Terriglobia bacterium]